MEHIEEAGIHSGDSNLRPARAHAPRPGRRTRSARATKALAKELAVIGLMNVQFAGQGTTKV